MLFKLYKCIISRRERVTWLQSRDYRSMIILMTHSNRQSRVTPKTLHNFISLTRKGHAPCPRLNIKMYGIYLLLSLMNHLLYINVHLPPYLLTLTVRGFTAVLLFSSCFLLAASTRCSLSLPSNHSPGMDKVSVFEFESSFTAKYLQNPMAFPSAPAALCIWR